MPGNVVQEICELLSPTRRMIAGIPDAHTGQDQDPADGYDRNAADTEGAALLASAVPSAVAVSMRLITASNPARVPDWAARMDDGRQLLQAGGWTELEDLPLDAFKTAWAIERLRKFLMEGDGMPLADPATLAAALRIYERQSGNMSFLGQTPETQGRTVFFRHALTGAVALLQHRRVSPAYQHLMFRAAFGGPDQRYLVAQLLVAGFGTHLETCAQDRKGDVLSIDGHTPRQTRDGLGIQFRAHAYGMKIRDTLAACGVAHNVGAMTTTLEEAMH